MEAIPTPPSSVHPDLVELAGGAEVIVARAEAKLSQGAPVDALHLVELVLTDDPQHGAALRASRDAHALLLERSENFWESSWLKNQINLLDAALDQ